MSDATTVIGAPAVVTEIVIPDFELEGCIGEGTFGQVYLARSKATGRYRAVKVVRRSRFQSDEPYDIEFAGLRRFEEVSREHEGFVDILHVSRNDEAGYFCYVMELADDLESARPCDPAHYAPRTLANELLRHGRVPPAECVRIALALAAALSELRHRDLVHRDVNLRNIVFVRGAPKLADVGLVTEAQSRPQTLIGTPDYMDPEVHGTPDGDLYSFGKVLYVMATGLEPKRWPELPAEAATAPDLPMLRELEAIWRKACHPHRRRRYATPAEVHAELLALQAGASVLRLKRFERALAWVRRYAYVLLGLLVSLAVALYFNVRERRQATELRQRKIGAYVARGDHALDNADYLGALAWFGEAWGADMPGGNDRVHRIRLGSILQRAPALERLWYQPRPPHKKEAWFPGEANQIVMSDAHGKWWVYDLWKQPAQPLYRQPFGQGLPQERISLSSRTKTAVSSADTNRIWLWNYETGAIRATWERPGAELGPAVISPDGQWIAVAARAGSTGGELLLWEVATPDRGPRVLDSPPTEPGGAVPLAFSPDARFLLSAVRNRARIWDLSTGRCLRQYDHTEDPRIPIFNGAFSPDSQYVVTASWDRSARIWEVRTGQEIARFTHDDAVWGAEFDTTGTNLVTAGLDSTARIWDCVNRTTTQFLRHNAKVLRATFSPQDRWLLTSGSDDTVRVWKLPAPPQPTLAPGPLILHGTRTVLPTNGLWSLGDRSGTVLRSLGVSNQPGVMLSFATDDRFFATSGLAGSATNAGLSVQVGDAANSSDTLLRQPVALSADWAEATLAVSSGGRWVATFNGRTGAVWNARSGQPVQRIPGGGRRATFSPDGTLFAIGRSNLVEVWDSEGRTGPLSRIWLRTNTVVASLDWDHASRRLITASTSEYFEPLEAETWTARTGQREGPPLSHRDGVLYAAFNQDGTRAITCSEDFTAILWDPKTGRQVTPPLRHRGQVSYATFSEDLDSQLVATTDAQVGITIWHAKTGERLTWLTVPLHRHGQRPWLRFSPDLTTLIVRAGGQESYTWTLPYYHRSFDELHRGARLLSAHEIDDSTGGLVPMSTAAVGQLWLELGTWPPGDAEVPAE